MCSSVMPISSASRAFSTISSTVNWKPSASRFLRANAQNWQRQNAVIGIVDVAVDDVAGAVAGLALPRKIRDRADGVEIFGFKQPQRIGFRNALAGGDFVINVAQFASLNEKIHKRRLTEIAGLAN